MKPLTCLKNTRSSGTEFVWMYLETAVYKSVILYPGKVPKYFLELLQTRNKLLPVSPPFTAFVNLVSSSPSPLLGQLFCWQLLELLLSRLHNWLCIWSYRTSGKRQHLGRETRESKCVFYTNRLKVRSLRYSVKEFSSRRYSPCVFPLVLEKQVLIR